MNAILFVLRTGCQWKALDATGICSCSSAYRRFREWTEADVFEAFWQGWTEYDGPKGIDWSWLSVDGALTKAPLAGKKTGSNSADRGKQGVKRSLLTEAGGFQWPLLSMGQSSRHEVDQRRARQHHDQASLAHGDSAAGIVFRQRLRLRRSSRHPSGVRFHGTPPGTGRRGQGTQKQAGFRARQWVVERTHSWLNRFRRILVRWEKLPQTVIAMLHLACGIITWRATGLLK